MTRAELGEQAAQEFIARRRCCRSQVIASYRMGPRWEYSMRGRLQSILARAPREGIRTLYNKCDPVLLSVLDGIEKLEIKVGIRSDGDGPKIFVARRTLYIYYALVTH